MCLAILTSNEECYLSRSTTCFGAKVYMCHDHVHLDNLSDISAYRTVVNHNVQQFKMPDLKSFLLSALRKSLLD